MRTQILASFAALALLLTASCTVGPNYSRPQVPTAPTYRGADNAEVSSAKENSLGDQKWADVFREPELQNLIRTALESNYDVRIAAERILEQEAQVRITRSQQFPTLNVGGTAVGAELPGTLSSFVNGPIVAGSFNLSAAWNPDFWGLYRRQTEAARAQLLAQAWAQRAVRLTLVQQVAATYLQLRALDRELDIARQTVKIRQDSVELTRTLERGGAVPLSDVRQAEQLLFQATSQVPELEQSIQQNENGLR